MVCIILADGSYVDSAKLVGNGADGFVVRYEDHVLKIPNLLGHLQPSGEIEEHEDNDLHRDALENEKAVYERLKHVHGVAECLGCTPNGIRLRYYANGTLHDLISRDEPPSTAWRWHWVLQATDIIARCHERGVLVLDIALRNFVLTEEFDLRIIDFANSSLVSPAMDITKVNIDGGTVLLDLLYLSTVIYSILTWQDFRTHCYDETDWPSEDSMPVLEGHDFAPIIQKCWLRKYASVHDLTSELWQYAPHPPIEPLDGRSLTFAQTQITVQSSLSDSPPETGQPTATESAPQSTNPFAWWTFILPVVTGGLRSLLRWLALGAAKLRRLAF